VSFKTCPLALSTSTVQKKINEVPFPFPYAQMVTVMLLVFTAVTPVALGLYAGSPYTAAAMTFITTSIYWCINYIAAELEMPFGKDANDLPMLDFQEKMNTGLKTLLEEHAQIPPLFDLSKMRSVMQESPMSWEEDGVIAAPVSGGNMGSMDFKLWFDALESRKRPVIPKVALDGSIERLSAVSTATWQAVQGLPSRPLWSGISQSNARRTDLCGTNIAGFESREDPHFESLDPSRPVGHHHTTAQEVETPPDLGSSRNLFLRTAQPTSDLSASQPAIEPGALMSDNQALHLAIIDPETESVSI